MARALDAIHLVLISLFNEESFCPATDAASPKIIFLENLCNQLYHVYQLLSLDHLWNLLSRFLGCKFKAMIHAVD